MARGGDLSIFRALGGLFIGAPMSGVCEMLGNTALSIYHLPRVYIEVYRALWNEARIGPNLKTVIGILIPPSGLLIPPLTAVGSLMYGLGMGFFLTALKDSREGGLPGVWDSIIHDFKWCNRTISENMAEYLNEHTQKALSDGKKPFDIRIWEAMKGLASAVVCAPMGAAGGAAIIFRNLIPSFRILRRVFLKEMLKEMPVIACSIFALAVPILIIAIPLFILAGIGFGLYEGCRYGYTDGFRASIVKMWDEMKKLYNKVKKFMDEGLSVTKERSPSAVQDEDGK
jgi:hypothetical protein